MEFQWVPILVDKGQLQGCAPRLTRRTSCPILDRAYLSRKNLCYCQIPITHYSKAKLNGASDLTDTEWNCKQSPEWNQLNGGGISRETCDNNPDIGKWQSSLCVRQFHGITNGNTNLWCGRWGDRQSSSSESMFTAVEELDGNSMHSSEISLSLFHTVIACDVCGQQPCTNQTIYHQHSQEQSSFAPTFSEKDLNMDTFVIDSSPDGTMSCKNTCHAYATECKGFCCSTKIDTCKLCTREASKPIVGNFMKSYTSATTKENDVRPLSLSVLEEGLSHASECQTLSNLDLFAHSPRSFILNHTEVITQGYLQKRPKADLPLCDSPSITWLYYDDECLNCSEYFHELQYYTEDVMHTKEQEREAKPGVHLPPFEGGQNLSVQNSTFGNSLAMSRSHDDENGNFSTVSRNNSLDGTVLYHLCCNANQASDKELLDATSETEVDSAQYTPRISGLDHNTEDETASLGCYGPRASLINEGNRPSLFSISGVVVDANELESIIDVPAEFTAAEVYLRRAIQAGSIIEKDNSACDRPSLNKKLARTADSGQLRSSLFLKPPQPVRDDTLTDNPSFVCVQSKENLASDVPVSAVDQTPPNRQHRSSLNLIYTAVHLPLVEENAGSISFNEQSEPEPDCATDISRKFTAQSWATIDSTEISRGLKLPGGLEKSLSEDSETLITSVQSVEPVQASKVCEPRSLNLLPPETVECAHYNLELGTFTITPALHNCHLANKLASSCYRRTVSPDPAQFIKLMKKLAFDRTRSKHDRLTAPGKLSMH